MSLYALYTFDDVYITKVSYVPSNFTGIAIYDGLNKHWFLNGKQHRLDGPASEYWDGHKTWFVDGELVTEEQHNLLYSIMKLKGLL